MTLVLDSGGVSALAGHRARLAELRRRGQWPPQVASVVLTEVLTGDHRRDFHHNKVVSLCQVRPVTEELARTAARLRGKARDPRAISATDAVVAALATTCAEAIVLTSDPRDLAALLEDSDVAVVRV